MPEQKKNEEQINKQKRKRKEKQETDLEFNKFATLNWWIHKGVEISKLWAW